MRLWGNIELAEPWFLTTAILAIPAYTWAHLSAGRVVFSSLRALPFGGKTWRTRLAWLPDAMLALAVVALAIAFAGPRAGDKSSRVHRDGIAVMMAVDVSGSMRAQDLAGKQGAGCDEDPNAEDPTRLGAVKRVFTRFVLGGDGLDGREDDAIGLVAFARYADTRSPLTLDHANLVTAARHLEFADPKDDGTAIGAGLELAVERLKGFQAARSKVVLLLTDGESNVHDIAEDKAIDEAVAAGIKVYTIGAGTNGDAPICMDLGGPAWRNGARQGLGHFRVSIDETLLRKIADKTGGQYFRATDGDSLAKIYKQIDKLERSTFEEERFTRYAQYYVYFVLAALGLVAAAFGLRGTVLRRLP